LTSGRSGLASAVIYQPSCPQNYSQECTIAQNPTKRDYDDNRRLPPNDGNNSSMNCNYSSNVYENLRGSGSGSGNRDSNENVETNCDENEESPKKVKSSCIFTQMRERCRARSRHLHHLQQQQQQHKLNDINSNLEKVIRNHTKCKNPNASCSMQRLRRRFQYFLYHHIRQSDYPCKDHESKT
jgi:hypothetical protein